MRARYECYRKMEGKKDGMRGREDERHSERGAISYVRQMSHSKAVKAAKTRALSMENVSRTLQPFVYTPKSLVGLL